MNSEIHTQLGVPPRCKPQEYKIGTAHSFRVLNHGGSCIRIISKKLHRYGNLHRFLAGPLFQSCAKPRVVAAVAETEGNNIEVGDSSERQCEGYSGDISEMYANEIERPAQPIGRTTYHYGTAMRCIDGNARMGEPMSEHSDDDEYVSWCDY